MSCGKLIVEPYPDDWIIPWVPKKGGAADNHPEIVHLWLSHPLFPPWIIQKSPLNPYPSGQRESSVFSLPLATSIYPPMRRFYCRGRGRSRYTISAPYLKEDEQPGLRAATDLPH